jgi:hypothetical protein
MPRAETQRLVTELELHDKFGPGIDSADRKLSGFDKKATGVFGHIKQGFGIGIGVAAFNASINIAGRAMAGFSGIVESGIQSFNELQSVQAATAAVIKSTGGIAHVTTQQIRDLSSAGEDLTTIDDKTVQAGANLLLTFTNIRNEAGKGNDIFNQTVTSLLDMAVTMNKGNVEGIDLKATAIQLGKALNDPVKGITALGKAGITFTEAQKKQIKQLVKTNDLLGAQKIVLGEVKRETGGAAAAQAGTYAAQQARLADSIEQLKINLVTGLVPGLTRVSKALADTFRSKEFQKAATDLGNAIGNILSGENIRKALEGAKSIGRGLAGIFSGENISKVADFAKTTLPALADGLKIAGSAAKFMFDIWKGMPKELQSLLVAGLVANKLTGGLVTKGIGGAVGGAFGAIRGGSRANPVFVQDVSGVGAGGGSPVTGKGGGIAGKLIQAVSIVSIAADAFAVFQTWQDVNAKSSAAAQDAQDNLTNWLKTSPKREDLVNGLAAVDKGLADIQSNPLNVLVQGDAINKLEAMKTTLQNKLAALDQKAGQQATSLAAIAGSVGGIVPGIAGPLGAGLAAATLAIWAVQAAVRGIPAFFGSAADQGRGTGPDRRPKVTPEPRDPNRNPRTTLAPVKLSVTHRDVTNAGSLHIRYGPTPSGVGAR